MSIEIEKKYLLTADERSNLVLALKETDVKFVGEDFEENIIFTGGILNDKQAVLRLRRIGEKTLLTYKERLPTQSGIKHQIEHETMVEDFAAALQIFESLGFTRSLVYEKKRRTWRFDDVEVVLDELPFGLYMEIEGTVEAIEKTEKLLGIETLEAVHETYPQLTARSGKRNGEVIEARFDK
ncbi:MAG TPA: class IV adenylate cyclase [Pyrinomonadaceae bacterium]|jgi:adenylate cyclase class 2|nr:class IV adenylate cyclase [Pyrinomonadaceae bacterium]